jgi:AbiV family abortive infection protein
MTRPGTPKPQFRGRLTFVQTANAIRASRLNAIELADTADMLFQLKRFAHSVALSILSLEESAKPAMLVAMLTADDGELSELWRSYHSHRAKTSSMGAHMGSQFRAMMPEIPPEEAHKIGEDGPSPDEFEAMKQRAIYSECYDWDGEVMCHQPGSAEWRQLAWERLCEAQTLAFGQRDIRPLELELRASVMKAGKESGQDLPSVIREMYAQLKVSGVRAYECPASGPMRQNWGFR